MMENRKVTFTTTTFQISHKLHDQLKLYCVLTHKSMGEFIRIAIGDKIKQLKEKTPPS